MVAKSIATRFSAHSPGDPAKAEMAFVRAATKVLALDLNRRLPEGDEKDRALERLEEVVFWSNAAIAREGKA